MATSKVKQLIPSTGVLLLALGAAIVAAILVNVYISHAEDEYAIGSEWYLMLKEDVPKGTQITERHLTSLRVPKPMLKEGMFADVLREREKSLALGKRAPRDFRKGQILYYIDFSQESEDLRAINPPKGYELISIPVMADNKLGQQLQPGMSVNIYGDFDLDPDEKKEDIRPLEVIKNVQVRALGGVADIGDKIRSYDTIQIFVRAGQAQLILQIQKMLKSRRFTVTVAHQEGGDGFTSARTEPEIAKAVLALLERPRTPPVPPG